MRFALGSRLGWSVMVALALGRAATAVEPVTPVPPGPDAVYVSDNSEYYHRGDCRRVHFATAVTLAEAEKQHRPCPVCQPLAAGAAPAVVTAPAAPPAAGAPPAVAPPAATAVPAPGAPPAGKPRRPGKYRWLGLGIGVGLGFLGGAAIDFSECFLQDCNETKETFLVLGMTIGGGLAGYAIAGGFSDRSEEAFDRGREAIRQALEARPAEPACTLAAAPGAR